MTVTNPAPLTAEVLARVAAISPADLHAGVTEALRSAEVEDGAIQLTEGHGYLLADPVEGEVWAGEAVGSAADSLRYGIAHIAAAIAAGATL